MTFAKSIVYTATYASGVLGDIALASDGARLTGLYLAGQKYYFDRMAGPFEDGAGIAVLEQARAWLDRYFAGMRPDPAELPLAPAGSDFRRRVWDILLSIPYGATRTYGSIAHQLEVETGRRASAQAVGGAVGHNPISIVIPCHRVVGSDGSLTGYAGGVRSKLWLLGHEGADMTDLYVPVRGTAL